MCEINIADSLYNYARVFGWEAVDESLTLGAAKTKLKHYNILSLADSYLIALARRLKATIITTDQSVYNVARTRTILLHV